jgi:hypothetical protein
MSEQKIALWLIPLILFVSFIKHSIWVGFGSFALIFALVEFVVPLLVILVLLIISNLLSSVWPLRVWILYALVVIILKLVDLHYMIDIL